MWLRATFEAGLSHRVALNQTDLLHDLDLVSYINDIIEDMRFPHRSKRN